MKTEKLYDTALLLDFYGTLLTDKQRECLEMYYNEDLSQTEIAERFGITRQGARDFLVRAENTLLEIEDKTKLVGRFHETREVVAALESELSELVRITNGRARELAESSITRLQDLKT